MILTGKAKEDFLKWYYYNNYHHQVFTETSDDIFINALIIEWIDSVGIFISINYVSFYDELRNDKGFEAYVTNNGLSVKFRIVKNRQEAIEKAIKKANEIYNNIHE